MSDYYDPRDEYDLRSLPSPKPYETEKIKYGKSKTGNFIAISFTIIYALCVLGSLLITALIDTNLGLKCLDKFHAYLTPILTLILGYYFLERR